MTRFRLPKPHRRVWYQSIFWLGYFLLGWLSSSTYVEDYKISLWCVLLNFPLLMLAGYWHLLVTVKRYLLVGRMTGFWLNLLGGLVVFGLLGRFINYLFFYPSYYPEGLLKPLLYWPTILTEALEIHLVAGLFIAIELARHALQQQQLSDTYRREKLAAEYRLLQSQVQPHFLFNTLNNLTSVSLKQPAQMPRLLQRLAGLLSYQLHESHRPAVPLTKEISYLSDYIALEQLRYGDRLDVQTNFNELTALDNLMIPPLLLLPFVENAFKHGAARTETDCWIQLHVSHCMNRLVFSVENSIPDNVPYPEASGLGLTNLRKRLDILFPGQYELVTLPEDSQFLAVLKFNVN